MIPQLEQYVTGFYGQPIMVELLAYVPWLIPFTETYPLETAILMLCAVIFILSVLYNLVFPPRSKLTATARENPLRADNKSSRLPKYLQRKLASLPHPDMPLYDVNITDDIAGTIIETDSDPAQSESQPPVIDTDGLSPSARAMLDQLRHDGKLKD
ncbi:hypothetical protein OAT37_03795 [Alphaproteobacteria bacterium]|jgi:hypothetical protein|nr:hypothetical protein [Alphaproteobacteria bacterium]